MSSLSIQLKSALSQGDLVLSDGEIGYATDTKQMFLGTPTGNFLIQTQISTEEYFFEGMDIRKAGSRYIVKLSEKTYNDVLQSSLQPGNLAKIIPLVWR